MTEKWETVGANSADLQQLLEARIDALMQADPEDFGEMARAAGLDPGVDFIWADLAGSHFGRSDLSAFDFSGADLTGANLENEISPAKTMAGARREAKETTFLEMVVASNSKPATESVASCVAFSPDGSRIVSGAGHNILLLWDIGPLLENARAASKVVETAEAGESA